MKNLSITIPLAILPKKAPMPFTIIINSPWALPLISGLICVSTNNDIVGGNSGSPLIDMSGNVVGLMFDGNIDSIAGSYWFDATKNRAIAVHPAIIREALDKVYGAKGLLAELGAS